VALIAVPIGVDHRDLDAVDQANCVGAFLAIVETIVDPLYGRSVENPCRVLKGDPMSADIAAFFAGSHVNRISSLYGMYLPCARCKVLRLRKLSVI
jgi:hypothetical protein